MARAAAAPENKAISIRRAEWDALARLPHLQRALYLVLRWYMDVATRRVGLVRGISLKGLAEELEVDAAPGRADSGQPSRKAVRHALEQLEKHSLVQPCGNGEVMVFLLPKAGAASARPNLKGHERGTASGRAMGHGETPTGEGVAPENGHAKGQPQNPLKGHTSEVRVNPPYTEPTAASCLREELSTGPLLMLPVPAEMAERLRFWERRRGKVAPVTSSDPLLAEWAQRHVDEATLREAYDLAVMSREAKKNPAPINAGFVNVFINRVLNGRQVSRKGEGTAPRPWWLSPEGIEAKANQYGLTRAAGESNEALRGRVERAMVEADYEAWQARRRQ